ncbi:sulfite exporter TauE/SafE family protein [Alicyclobacillus sp. ALC3]|uniref:sulfite exporter TauE/SafE family protein n=1 Tax=Alicyclobacillus sp. ALC3 TaxID=2796143 RepID=UPI0023781D87|nr:sulfite exporter TauE/SafE family protein [Alicyclobacillus sp. ALC3]WDL95519.1 sulfite exporter TauE/SafE family protein [Alicyclobacillus sp. ALC3]
MTELQIALSVASGAVVGFALGLLGGGGSILAVPLLLYVVGIHDAHVVIGSTAMAVAVNAYFNLLPHARAGHVRWKPGIWFAVFGVVGAAIGSRIGQLVPSKDILFLFASFMLFMAYRMVKGRSSSESSETSGTKQRLRLGRLGSSGVAVGLLSGFFGIGGGFLIVPGLVFSAGLSMVEAVGTSLFSVGTFGLTTAVSYSLSGLVDWGIVVPFILGGAVGGLLGVRSAVRLGKQKQSLRYVFSGVIVVVAVYMLVMNLHALYGHIA